MNFTPIVLEACDIQSCDCEEGDSMAASFKDVIESTVYLDINNSGAPLDGISDLPDIVSDVIDLAMKYAKLPK